MKHLLIVTDAWTPQINGVVVTLKNTIEELEKRGHRVSLIHPGMFRFTFPLPTYPEIRLSLCSVGRMRKLIEAADADDVHIATEGTLGLVARIACKRHKQIFTTAYHTHFPLYVSLRVPGLKGLVYFLLRWFHNASAATMVATESLHDELTTHGFTNLVMWSRGVNTDLFKPATCTMLSLKKPCFVFFGRIAVEKNVEEFLSAALPGSKLIIGDGPDRDRLEQKYGASATFVGYKSGQQLVDALACADVSVFPSRTDTFGLTIIESLACGLPVAAHDTIGPRDILSPGIDGFLSEDLAEAALSCLSLSRDECRAKAQQYSWERSTEMFISNISTVSK